VRNVRRHRIRPVIAKDFVIGSIGERSGAHRSDWFCGRRGPAEALAADEVDDAAVFGLDVAGPMEIATELGGIAFEKIEIVVR